MLKQGVKKIRAVATGSLVVLALASQPVNAHHNHSIVGPAVAFFTLGALLHHSHHNHHSYHGSYSSHQRRHYKSHRRHSRSSGGYHKPRGKHYNH